MTNRAIIESYYQFANAGDWMQWCDLFDSAMVMDEQLGGHIEGLAKLREMMKGMGAAYARFTNVPLQILIDGDKAAVKSHISARAAKYPEEPIESDVMNYFTFKGGKIAYMSNHHDSRPFAPFLRQISGG